MFNYHGGSTFTLDGENGQKAWEGISKSAPYLSLVKGKSLKSKAVRAERPNQDQLAALMWALNTKRPIHNFIGSMIHLKSAGHISIFEVDNARFPLHQYAHTDGLLTGFVPDSVNYHQNGPVGILSSKGMAALTTLINTQDKLWFVFKSANKGFIFCSASSTSAVSIAAAAGPLLKKSETAGAVLIAFKFPNYQYGHTLSVDATEAEAQLTNMTADTPELRPAGTLTIKVDSTTVATIAIPAATASSKGTCYSSVVSIPTDFSGNGALNFTFTPNAADDFLMGSFEIVSISGPTGSSVHMANGNEVQDSELGSIVGNVDASSLDYVVPADRNLIELAYAVERAMAISTNATMLQRLCSYAEVNLTASTAMLSDLTEANVWSLAFWMSGRTSNWNQTKWRRLYVVWTQMVSIYLKLAIVHPDLGELLTESEE